MKHLIILAGMAFIASCKSPDNTTSAGISTVETETAHYKIYKEAEGELQPTPADMFLEYSSGNAGSVRTQRLEGPGIALYDTLYLHPDGTPNYRAFRQGKTRNVLVYSDSLTTLFQGSDTLIFPHEYPRVFDASQVDLVVATMDKLDKTEEVPFVIAPTGNIDFMSLAEVGPDTIIYDGKPLPTIHRYALKPGSVSEYWIVPGEMLPYKFRLTDLGHTYLYLRVDEASLPQ